MKDDLEQDPCQTLEDRQGTRTQTRALTDLIFPLRSASEEMEHP